LGVVFPLAGGYLLSSMLGMNTFEALFFGLVLSATSVSISVQTLREMNKLQSREGMAILGAAVLDDIIVIILLAFLMSFIGGDVSIGQVILTKAAFFAVALLAAWKVVPWVLSKLSAFRIPHAPIAAALLICFAFAYYAESTGVAAIIGAYLAGIAIGQTNMGHQIMQQAEIVGYSLFVPVFFVSIGFSAQVTGLGDYVWLIVPISILAVLTKMIGGGLGARFAGYPWMPSIRVGAGMVSRGEVALILASMGLKDGLLDSGLFTTLIIVVLVTTLVTPPLLKLLFSEKKGKQQAVDQSV
jgi:Kef-type K+ transport system membrane component KefB